MKKFSLDDLMEEASKLPPFPRAAQKALTLIRDREAGAVDLAKVLGTDQVLSAHVLRWANSAFYGMGNRIVTVQQAIVVLGMNTIQELVMSYTVSDKLNRPVPGYDLQRGELWHHALGTAIGAKLISKQRHLRMDEEAYFAGLLCDIGKLVFEKLLREADIHQEEWEQHSFLEMERALFGIDHAMLGAEMARRWQLPENLVEAIEHHHDPQAAREHATLVAAIHVADMSMMILGIGIGVDGLRYPLDEAALQRLGMTGDDMIGLVDQISNQLDHAKELISLG